MNRNKFENKIKYKYFFIILVLILILTCSLIFYYIIEKKSIEKEEYNDLKSISDLKTEQIKEWIGKIILLGNLVKSSMILPDYLNDTSDTNILYLLKDKLSNIIYDPSFGNIRIFDKNKKLIYCYKTESFDISFNIQSLIDNAITNDSVILSDFFFCEFHKKIHLELIVPIKEEKEILGIALIDILPEVNLYPMIQTYPLHSKTSEIILVRKEGENALVLNDLRHRDNTALKLKLPLTSKEFPEVRAVLGDTGFIKGKDYRGKDVLAYIRKVQSTNWFMVTKKDVSEAYSFIGYYLLTALMIILFILSVSMGIIVFHWLNQRNKFLEEEFESQNKIKSMGVYLSGIIESSPIAIYDLDADGRIKSIWNKGAEKIFGYKKEDVIGKYLPTITPEKEEEFKNYRKKVFEGHPFTGLETLRKKANGEIINVNISTAPIYDLDDNINGIIVLVQDITERIIQQREIEKRSGELQTAVMNLEVLNEELQTTEEELLSSEEELRTQVEELDKSQKELLETEEKLRIAIKNANISVFTQNNLLEYTWVYNPPEGLTASMIIGKKDSDFLSQEDANKIISLKEGVLRTKVFEQKEIDLQMGGQKRYFNYIVEPMYENNDKVKGLICAAVDLTEKRRMEEELFQAYKMEAIGQLAGGIAHDFNNMLAGIMGSAEMLQYKLSGNETLLYYVFNIIKASEHAARLTSQLLSFARKGQYQKIPLSVHRVISEVVSMLENTIDKKIIIEQKLTANPHVILGDPTQIQSVILNLMLNARDALIDGSGKIIISTEIANINKELSEKYRKGISPWQFILISVSDNGIGMTEEVKRHLFEPFFTTKEVGKGTGLGLASIYGVVKNHNGIIDVDSQEGSGTTMKIYIPISLIEPEEMDEDIYPLETFNGMGMTILVIDDEELILKTIEEILLKFGFNVILAKSGRDGIEIYKENYNSIKVIILDMIMPDLNGKETLIELKKISKNAKVLISTGYSADEEANKLIEIGTNGFIQKPFMSNELLRKLHEITK